jgi:hypothetical protein
MKGLQLIVSFHLGQLDIHLRVLLQEPLHSGAIKYIVEPTKPMDSLPIEP